MKNVYILGIESSCDETACSIVKNGSEIISNVVNSQILIHTKYGGVVPEIASRKHIESITVVIEECLNQANMTIDEIDAIAVTYGPGLMGSLLVGLEAAKTLSFIYNKPLIPVHHIAGHIYANNLVKEIKYPALCLVISGGHTELVLIEEEYKFKILGTTLDDAVGECYDKIARVLDIPYPGGPIIDEMSKKGNDTYKLPMPLNDDSYNFSFSGLKSAFINLVHNETQRGNKIRKKDLACSFQNVVSNILAKKSLKAIKEYNVKYFIAAGGVAANHEIRRKLKQICENNNIEYSFPDISYCTDNAAMIAAAGYFAFKKGTVSNLNINAMSSIPLE
ncbi:MAG: tRNA (adenosine(37)-N6)-threonylcarbamoyltransferase complex transferase subunit TsaD [bacterium]|nr:tRNA (adenosine(37)-N6)-threonylcarbamoyltransferase complex transferase subunit TsaD [bacterium]